MADERIIDCGKEGCIPLQLLRQSVLMTLEQQSRDLSKTSEHTSAALREIQATARAMNETLIRQNERLQIGSKKFDDLEEELTEVRQLKTRITVIEDRMPQRGMTAATSGATATGVWALIEIVKAIFRGGT